MNGQDEGDENPFFCENSAMKMRLSHILVKQKFEAEDLLRKLKEGASFEGLAQKFSTCSSSQVGGDLGLVDLSRLDSDFAEVAQGLTAGQVSEIVRTRFGYHLIMNRG